MRKSILVSGASTGIGYDISRHLGEMDHLVYATARKPADLEKLSKLKNVVPVELDVCKPEEIFAAVSFIESQGTGLYGLVNNAGLGGLGPFYAWSETELQHLFDVNAFGPWRMGNAFLSLLLASKGRIVNIGSQGGMITQKYFGPYTMTKHALEAYTTAMREELEPYGIHVSIVQPGGVASNIGPNALPGIVERFQRAKAPFKKEAQAVLASIDNPKPPASIEAPESAENRKPSSPIIVSEAVSHALFSESPQNSYLVGTRWEGDRVINSLLKKLVLANQSPNLNYSRGELIALLDKYLAAS